MPPLDDHEHYYIRPIRLDFCKGYQGPVDVFDCYHPGCQYRRIVARGGSPFSAPDPREIHYNELQDWKEVDTLDNTGGGVTSPALWLTMQAQERPDG